MRIVAYNLVIQHDLSSREPRKFLLKNDITCLDDIGKDSLNTQEYNQELDFNTFDIKDKFVFL